MSNFKQELEKINERAKNQWEQFKERQTAQILKENKLHLSESLIKLNSNIKKYFERIALFSKTFFEIVSQNYVETLESLINELREIYNQYKIISFDNIEKEVIDFLFERLAFCQKELIALLSEGRVLSDKVSYNEHVIPLLDNFRKFAVDHFALINRLCDKQIEPKKIYTSLPLPLDTIGELLIQLMQNCKNSEEFVYLCQNLLKKLQIYVSESGTELTEDHLLHLICHPHVESVLDKIVPLFNESALYDLKFSLLEAAFKNKSLYSLKFLTILCQHKDLGFVKLLSPAKNKLTEYPKDLLNFFDKKSTKITAVDVNEAISFMNECNKWGGAVFNLLHLAVIFDWKEGIDLLTKEGVSSHEDQTILFKRLPITKFIEGDNVLHLAIEYNRLHLLADLIQTQPENLVSFNHANDRPLDIIVSNPCAEYEHITKKVLKANFFFDIFLDALRMDDKSYAAIYYKWITENDAYLMSEIADQEYRLIYIQLLAAALCYYHDEYVEIWCTKLSLQHHDFDVFKQAMEVEFNLWSNDIAEIPRNYCMNFRRKPIDVFNSIITNYCRSEDNSKLIWENLLIAFVLDFFLDKMRNIAKLKKDISSVIKAINVVVNLAHDKKLDRIVLQYIFLNPMLFNYYLRHMEVKPQSLQYLYELALKENKADILTIFDEKISKGSFCVMQLTQEFLIQLFWKYECFNKVIALCLKNTVLINKFFTQDRLNELELKFNFKAEDDRYEIKKMTLYLLNNGVDITSYPAIVSAMDKHYTNFIYNKLFLENLFEEKKQRIKTETKLLVLNSFEIFFKRHMSLPPIKMVQQWAEAFQDFNNQNPFVILNTKTKLQSFFQDSHAFSMQFFFDYLQSQNYNELPQCMKIVLAENIPQNSFALMN